MPRSPTGARIEGLKEFRAALKAMGPQWPKELRAVHKKIAETGTERSQSAARRMGGEQGHFADAIRPRANQRQAIVAILPRANAAFWGAKKRTGWYARGRYNGGPPQHPPWVGNTWDVAEFGEGPYAINDALARYKPEMLEEYLKMIDGLARRAFPSP